MLPIWQTIAVLAADSIGQAGVRARSFKQAMKSAGALKAELEVI